MKNLDIKEVSILNAPYIAKKNSKEYSYFKTEYKNQLTENNDGDLIVYNSVIKNSNSIKKLVKRIKKSMSIK